MPPTLSSPASRTPAMLSRNEAQARTAIAQRAMGLPLQCGGSQWRARLRPVIAPEWSGAGDDTYASIEWAGARLQLQLPTSTVQQLMSALLDGAALPPIPPEMQTAALEAALAELLASLERLGRGAPQITASGVGHPPAALAHAFIWHLDAEHAAQDCASMAGMLRADSLGLLLMAGLATNLPLHDGPLASDELAVQLHLDIGDARITADELLGLETGDVLLMEHRFLAAERVLWLQAPGAGGLHVQLPAPQAAEAADNTAASAPFLTVVQPWNHAMPTFDTSPTEAADFDGIPVRLSFDLGEISLTLAELRTLQPGQTVRLGHPIASAVRIRANGALIGEGELVEIDGHLGVSIQQLFASAKSAA